ncbi:helix-turn-helix domain-containing protein [Saxibacter everestensis]|uniref:Helix-turn-helix domain-containing protein n=1 Tax=Saxibacter everestensis TaxID=2909229 RepID=A0ABY8QSC2_9MICO|nr:helix-turn-helix domain-containing protein [Brevibacteriaceae bacterium ZFBP1038]
MASADSLSPTPPLSQTLSRGLRVLELLTGESNGLSIAQISQRLEVHRSIAYRLIQTLEHHGLITKGADSRYALGAGLAVLARSVATDLQSTARPVLAELSDELQMTAFVVVEQADRCVTLLSVEPHAAGVVAQRPGTVHSVERGAPGLALLATTPTLAPEHAERADDVAQVRASGFAHSHDEVIPGMQSVAVPLTRHSGPQAALAVVYVASELDPTEIGNRLQAAAARIV